MVIVQCFDALVGQQEGVPPRARIIEKTVPGIGLGVGGGRSPLVGSRGGAPVGGLWDEAFCVFQRLVFAEYLCLIFRPRSDFG